MDLYVHDTHFGIHLYGTHFGIHLYGLAGMLPLLLLWLGGGVLCLIRFRQSPLFYLLVGTALAVQILSTVVLPFVTGPVLEWISRLDLADPYSPGPLILVSTLMYTLPGTLAWALLLWAVFWTKGPYDPTRQEI